MAAAKVNDQKFLSSSEHISDSMIIFDRANDYNHQFALRATHKVYFVTRMKKFVVNTVLFKSKYKNNNLNLI
jgi:hypothetical protein